MHQKASGWSAFSCVILCYKIKYFAIFFSGVGRENDIHYGLESPIKATKGAKRGRKRKSSESCEELSSPPKAKAAIVEAFAHQSAKQPKKKEVTTKPVATAAPAPQLKPVDAKDFFGSQSAWKQDRGRLDAKPKPAAAADHGAKQQNVTPKKRNFICFFLFNYLLVVVV
jgi:hypothetical protein